MTYNNATRPVRATVQAGSYSYGSQASVLIDGSTTPVTLQPYLQYQPTAGDRLLVQSINHVLEVVQFLSTSIAVSTDPLAQLIARSGQAFVASEATIGTLVPAVPAAITLTVGIVWFDLTPNVGNAGNGNYYVYTHGIAGYATDWTQVTNPGTLALCAGLNTSQAPVGNGTFVLYVDPLAQGITAASNVFLAATSASPPSGLLTTVATLSSALSVGSPITALPTTTAAIALLQAQALFVISGANNQTWDSTGSPASVTSEPVVSQTPTFNFPSGSVVSTGFHQGDIARQTDTGLWFVYTAGPGQYTGTWADWTQITYASTIVLCEALAVSENAPTDNLNQALGQLAADIAASNNTGLFQDLQVAFQAVIASTIAQLGLPSNVSGLNALEAAMDTVAGATPTFLYANSTDSIAGEVMGNLALQIMAFNTASDAQTLFNVTDSSATGTAAKITGESFLADYTGTRGTLP